ncbi:hypothetical protein ABPG77_005277 [Micractinium sp. CCAP 211/92]
MALSMDRCSPLREGGSSGNGSWRLGDVRWGRVLSQQDYGSILSSVTAIVALAITAGVLGGPTSRPFMVTDATISFPHNDTTVPYWLACTISALTLLLSVLACELALGRRLHADLTDALAAVLHFLIDGIAAFAVTALATGVIKMSVGRLRPDFLARCQPVVPNPLTIQYGLPASDNPACQMAPSGELTDGHYSFPSGHTSTVFVFAVWCTAYCVWAFYQRPPPETAASVAARPLRERCARDLGAAAGFLWILAMLAWATYVGVSRITDFKHHPSDVVAGAFLGALLGLLFAARAVLRVSLVVVGTAAAGSWGACSSSAASEGTPEPSLLQSNRVHQAAGNGTRIAVV